jgi:hypothetical protein
MEEQTNGNQPRKEASAASILVAGDSTIDWMLAIPTVIAPVT